MIRSMILMGVGGSYNRPVHVARTSRPGQLPMGRTYQM